MSWRGNDVRVKKKKWRYVCDVTRRDRRGNLGENMWRRLGGNITQRIEQSTAARASMAYGVCRRNGESWRDIIVAGVSCWQRINAWHQYAMRNVS